MTLTNPLPAEGGSYIRNPDGSLVRQPNEPAVPEKAEEPEPTIAVKTPAKSAVKEA